MDTLVNSDGHDFLDAPDDGVAILASGGQFGCRPAVAAVAEGGGAVREEHTVLGTLSMQFPSRPPSSSTICSRKNEWASWWGQEEARETLNSTSPKEVKLTIPVSCDGRCQWGMC